MEKKYSAYYSGFGGLGIIEIEYGINDYVIYDDGFFGGKKKQHRAKIYYSNNPYFIYNGVRIHLNECIRCGI